MAIPALAVPITVDDGALQAAFDRAKAAISSFSTAGQGDLDALNARVNAMAGNLREKLDLGQILGRSGKSAKDSAAAFEELLREQDALARSAAAVRAQIDPLGAAQLKLNTQTAEHARLAAAGAISTKEQAAANMLAQKAFSDSEIAIGRQTGALKGSEAAHGEHAKAVGNSGFAVAETTHIIRSLADQLIAGQDPLRAFAVEGGRIQTLFQYGGGVSGVLSSLTGVVGGLVNPFTLLTGGVLAFGAAALYAASSYKSMQEQMARATMGAGQVTGLSGAGLTSLADASAALTGVGAGDSRVNAAALSATGKFDPSNITGALGLTKGYASTFDTSYSEAGSKLADIFSDPAKGAEKLNQSLGFLDAKTRDYITTLQGQGDMHGAIKALIDASSVSMNEQVRELGFWSKAWVEFGHDLSTAKDALGRAMGGQSLDPVERMKQAQSLADHPDMTALMEQARRSADEFKRNPEGARGAAMMGQTAGAYDPATDPYNLNEDVRRASQARDLQTRNTIAAAQSLTADNITRSTVPDQFSLEKMTADRDALSKALLNPDVVEKLGRNAGIAFEALDHLNIGLGTFKTGAQQIAEQSAFTVAGIQAETFAQKTAADFQKNYTETLERTHSVLDAVTTAEARRNETIAAANKNAEDAARQQQQQDAALGLKPAQRLELERDQAIANAQRTGDVGAVPYMGGAATNLGADDMTRFATAIKAIESSGGNYGALGPITGSGDRAYGAYQVMGANIPSWTKDALGRSLSPSEFLANQSAQDAVFKNQFGKSLATYGNANDAASVWFTGRPLSQGAGARDVLGTSGADYVNRFGAALPGSTNGGYVNGIPVNVGGIPSTASGTGRAAANDHFSKQYDNLVQAPITAASDALDAQRALIQVQIDTYGKSSDVIAAATEKQKMLNDYMMKGVPVTASMNVELDKLADKAGENAKVLEDFQKHTAAIVSTLDEVRGGVDDTMSSVVKAFAHGEDAGDAFSAAMVRFGDSLIDKGASSLTDVAFGKSGSGDFGLIGSLFKGITGAFAGGTDDAPGGLSLVGERGPELVKLPEHSSVIPNSVAFSGAALGTNITVGGHSIVVQGDANKETLALMDQKLEAANAAQIQYLQRNFNSLGSKSSKLYGRS